MIKMARAPGAREQRWAHLLCGPVDEAQWASGGSARQVDGSTQERIARLEAEVAALRATVEKLCAELGVTPTTAAD